MYSRLSCQDNNHSQILICAVGEESKVLCDFLHKYVLEKKNTSIYHKERKEIRRVGKEMKRKELVEFRTPQHPSLGTNHWGGASPLLARNVPKESLDQRYLRLNSIRTRDEIFPAFEDHFNWVLDSHAAEKKEHTAKTPRRITIRGLLPKFTLQKEKNAQLGSKKRSWFPRLDPHNRWPQGWC